jgi:hypothetical protein
MPGEPPSYWDYVKAAFWKPVRSRILGAMPLTQMLLVSFGLAGFFNPGFWLLGLAGIVAFVGGRSASAFRSSWRLNACWRGRGRPRTG